MSCGGSSHSALRCCSFHSSLSIPVVTLISCSLWVYTNVARVPRNDPLIMSIHSSLGGCETTWPCVSVCVHVGTCDRCTCCVCAWKEQCPHVCVFSLTLCITFYIWLDQLQCENGLWLDFRGSLPQLLLVLFLFPASRNTTPEATCFISAGCVNKQPLANNFTIST